MLGVLGSIGPWIVLRMYVCMYADVDGCVDVDVDVCGGVMLCVCMLCYVWYEIAYRVWYMWWVGVMNQLAKLKQ